MRRRNHADGKVFLIRVVSGEVVLRLSVSIVMRTYDLGRIIWILLLLNNMDDECGAAVLACLPSRTRSMVGLLSQRGMINKEDPDDAARPVEFHTKQ